MMREDNEVASEHRAPLRHGPRPCARAGLALLAAAIGLTTGAKPCEAEVSHLAAEYYLLTTEQALPPASAFSLVRFYRHRSPHRGLFGAGWGSNLETRLALHPDGRVTRFGFGAMPGQTFVPVQRGGAMLAPVALSYLESTLCAERRRGSDTLHKTSEGFIHAASGVKEHFDPAGRLVKVELGGGGGWTIRRAADGWPVSVRDRQGRETVLERDAAGRVVAVRGAHDGPSLRFVYDRRGRLAATQPATGGPWRYAYQGASGALMTSCSGPGTPLTFIRYANAMGKLVVAELSLPGAHPFTFTYEFGGRNPTAKQKGSVMVHRHSRGGGADVCIIDRFLLRHDQVGETCCEDGTRSIDGVPVPPRFDLQGRE
jgi:YD repeat-containing protein